MSSSGDPDELIDKTYVILDEHEARGSGNELVPHLRSVVHLCESRSEHLVQAATMGQQLAGELAALKEEKEAMSSSGDPDELIDKTYVILDEHEARGSGNELVPHLRSVVHLCESRSEHLVQAATMGQQLAGELAALKEEKEAVDAELTPAG
ncbi:hypothetical protein DIPPA_23996 [Diplonema papillatum]|nr:hypothetical protein DIPPA_23996 [Diplonema papillatum]